LADSTQTGRDISVHNIKVFLNEQELILTDAAGNTVEAFVYNDTTYVPIRAISENFVNEVIWDEENGDIIIKDRNIHNGNYFIDKVKMEKTKLHFENYTYDDNKMYMQVENNSEIFKILEKIKSNFKLPHIFLLKYFESIDMFEVETPETITEDMLKTIFEFDSVTYVAPVLPK
jgi:hypothetical protein